MKNPYEMTVEELCEELAINLHPWLDADSLDYSGIRGLYTHGADSGCYMPAVTYHEALKTMHEHGDEVFAYVMDSVCAEPLDISEIQSWSGMCVLYLSHACELWAAEVVAAVNEHDWEEDEEEDEE